MLSDAAWSIFFTALVAGSLAKKPDSALRAALRRHQKRTAGEVLSRALLAGSLGPQHDRAAFSCGIRTLDECLRKRASQHLRRRVAQIFVAIGGPHGRSSTSRLDQIPWPVFSCPPMAGFGCRPRRARPAASPQPVPAAILGRLAVGTSCQGKRLGEFLLADACLRVLGASQAMDVFALIVEAQGCDCGRILPAIRLPTFSGLATPSSLCRPKPCCEQTRPVANRSGERRPALAGWARGKRSVAPLLDRTRPSSGGSGAGSASGSISTRQARPAPAGGAVGTQAARGLRVRTIAGTHDCVKRTV